MAAFGLVTIGASLHFLKISLHFPKMQGISARDRFASDWLDGTFSSPKNPCQTGASTYDKAPCPKERMKAE
jgi:hypothetical protein